MTGLERLVAAFDGYIAQGFSGTTAMTFAVQHSARTGDGPFKIMRHALPDASRFSDEYIARAVSA